MIEKVKGLFKNHKTLAVILSVVIFVLLITEGVMLYHIFNDSDEPFDDIPVIGNSATTSVTDETGEHSSPLQTDISGGTSANIQTGEPDNTTSGTSSDTQSGEHSSSVQTDTSTTPSDTTSPPVNTTSPPANVSTGSANISVSFTSGNTWEDGGKTVTQYAGVVSNTGNSGATSWSVTVDVPAGTEIIGSWNGVYSISGNKLTIKNESYNGDIPAGGSTEIGFQLKSSGVLNLGGGTGTGTSSNSSNTSGNTSGNIPAGTPPGAYTPSNVVGKQGDDWLFAKGNKIVDKDGKEVWITGINWFGYNTGTNTFDGLWQSNLEQSLQSIADRGFNMLRVPFSVELIKNWQNGSYPPANYNQALNPNLNGKNSLEIFEYALDVCASVGLKVMIDIHSAESDPMGHMTNMWFTSKISVDDFYSSLEWMAYRYRNNDTILAYDLKNEPHGKPNETPRAIWNNSTTDPNNWKHVAQTAALKVLNQNPNVLVLVEGIEIYPRNITTNGNYSSKNEADYFYNWWGGNLRGVKDFPIELGRFQNKLVYSPHDYGPTVHLQPWFYAGYNYNTLMADCWRDNWFFIYEDSIAPLLIGEWGGFMSEPNLTWMTHMRTLIKNYKLHHTFWCYNQNSGDTGGMVTGDWVTWDEVKYAFVKEVLWQKDGKFVGLDHEVPLGRNGIALKDY
ncbi:MAG: cellulase family glycosylhydrolase [Oscillospiraceae bacterium]|nr:cellulase family glycosylhydrolase [Oscillospiraceae bacterium]